jgi:hypothetical protein
MLQYVIQIVNVHSLTLFAHFVSGFRFNTDIVYIGRPMKQDFDSRQGYEILKNEYTQIHIK